MIDVLLGIVGAAGLLFPAAKTFGGGEPSGVVDSIMRVSLSVAGDVTSMRAKDS